MSKTALTSTPGSPTTTSQVHQHKSRSLPPLSYVDIEGHSASVEERLIEERRRALESSTDGHDVMSRTATRSISSGDLTTVSSTSGSDGGQARRKEPWNMRQGPSKSRSCTNPICGIVFILVVMSWIGLAIFAYASTGLGADSFRPIDSEGNICGRGRFTSRPYLFFFNIFECGLSMYDIITMKGCSSRQVCVPACPNVTFQIDDQPLEPKKVSNGSSWLKRVVCLYEIRPALENITQLAADRKCARFYFASESVLNRCFPTFVQVSKDGHPVNELTHGHMKKDPALPLASVQHSGVDFITFSKFIENIGDDLIQSIGWIFALILFGLALALVWVLGMRYFAPIIAWSSIVLLMIILLGGVCFSLSKYLETRSSGIVNAGNVTAAVRVGGLAGDVRPPDSMTTITRLYFEDAVGRKVSIYARSPTLWLILLIILSVSFLVLGVIILGTLDQISITIKLIREASRAMACFRCPLLLPLAPDVVKLILLLVWLLFTSVIYNLGRLRYLTPDLGATCSPSTATVTPTTDDCRLRRFMEADSVMAAQLYNLFVYLWLQAFVNGAYCITLAGAFSTYYWTVDPRRIDTDLVATSFRTNARYHLGSVALGSFCVAAMRFLRCLIEFVYKRVKARVGPGAEPNVCSSSEWLMTILRCILAFTEKILAFMSYNTYIMIAISGQSFCPAAIEVFRLIVSNPIQALILKTLANCLLCASRLCITLINGLLAYWLFYGDRRLHYPWAPVVIVLVVTHIIAKMHLNVFQVGVDTMFLCFLFDYKLNADRALGTAKPYFTPIRIHRLLEMYQRREAGRRRGRFTISLSNVSVTE